MSVIGEYDAKKNTQVYKRFRMQYILSVLEVMRDKNIITEELFLNARTNALNRYQNGDKI